MHNLSTPQLGRKAIFTVFGFTMGAAAVCGAVAAPAAWAAEGPNHNFREAAATVTLVAENTDRKRQIDDLQQRIASISQRLAEQEETSLPLSHLILPGFTSNIPTAYGADKGSIAFGLGYQERVRFNQKSDGTMGLIVGLGDPEKIGFDVQATLLDLSQIGRRVSVGFKAHRLLANDYAVAFGVENLATHGFSDSGRSFYAVVSKKVRLKETHDEPFSRLYLTGGIGTNRFRSESNFRNDTGFLNVFGSAAINLSSSSTLFTEWTGQGLNVGVSLVPFKNVPLVITPALADIAGPAGDGTRFTLGVGYVVR